jgi:hypothetical protein
MVWLSLVRGTMREKFFESRYGPKCGTIDTEWLVPYNKLLGFYRTSKRWPRERKAPRYFFHSFQLLPTNHTCE